MKKLVMIVKCWSICLFILVAALGKGVAQTETGRAEVPADKNLPGMSRVNLGSAEEGSVTEAASLATRTIYRNDINARALRDFKNNFREVTSEHWSVIKDGFNASFMLNDVYCMVFYDCKGNWQYTLKTYDESKMPAKIRGFVKSVYYDYSITFVKEIKSGSTLTYLVQLADKKTYKTIKVTPDGEMDVVLELDRAR